MRQATVEGLMGQSLTLRAVLSLDALKNGAPEVLVGDEWLDRDVRWVHVAESRDIAAALRGGELLISEGHMFSTEADDRRFVRQVSERGIVGLIIELGSVLTAIPRHVIDEAREQQVVLIALHVAVAFIEVTEAVHRTLISENFSALDALQKFQDMLLDRLLAGADLPELLQLLSDKLGNPVVLERGSGGFLGKSTAGFTEHQLTAAWESIQRDLPSAPLVIQKEVRLRGAPAGRLIAIGLGGDFSPHDRLILERSASLLSLALTSDEQLLIRPGGGSKGFLSALLSGNMPPYIAKSRASSVGFEAQVLLPFAARMVRHNRARPVSVEDQLWQFVWRDVISELRNRRVPSIVELEASGDTILVVLGIKDTDRRAETADRLAQFLKSASERYFDEINSTVLCVAGAVHTWHAVGHGLETAIDALDGAVHVPPRPWFDAADLDIDRLLWSLRDNPDVARFARLKLDKLITYDRDRRSQLVHTLQTFIELSGQKAETARVLHLERQSLYLRLERIEEQLGVDLADADTRLGLQLALRMMPYVDLTPAAIDVSTTPDQH
jgi:purine catabolism regulator